MFCSVLARKMSTLCGIISFGILALLFYGIRKWKQNYWARKGVPQLKPDLIFGDLGPLIRGKKSFKDTFYDIYQIANAKGYKYLGVYAGGTADFVPLDLALIKKILTKDFQYFISHASLFHKNMKLSTHLFSMEGDDWKERRTKLTPVFTSGKMKVMFGTVAATSEELTKVVADMADANKSIDIKETLARFTTDVIASVAFGLEANSLRDPDNLFRRIGKRALQKTITTVLSVNILPKSILVAFGFQIFPREVTSYFIGIVRDAIQYREKCGVERKDFMQLMIQLKNYGTLHNIKENGLATPKQKYFITEEEILNESFLFFLAGFETSSSTMTFAFFELAQNPTIQEKLREEIHRVLEKHGNKITYESLIEMEYLDKVVKETLRKYPVLPALPRLCTKDYKIPDTDIIIERGTRVHIPAIGIQRDPKYYPNPEEFNPENFSAENVANRPDFTYMPFGEGPRQCIGMRFGLMQVKIGIVDLLNKFSFRLDESMKPPYEASTGIRIYTFKKPVMLVATKISRDQA